MRRWLKRGLLLLTIVVSVTILYKATQWRSCSGLSDCYFSWRLLNEGKSLLEGERHNALGQFAASSRHIVFPAPVASGTTGVVVIGVADDQRQIFLEEGTEFYYPSLSADGKRLLIVRRRPNSRDLLSCSVETWHCAVILQTEQTLHSPVEIEKNTVLYSSSPRVVGLDKKVRYGHHDFYLLKSGADPVRLTDFKFYQLDSINIVGEQIVFSALGASRGNPVIAKQELLAPKRSEIYPLRFDRATQTIPRPQGQLPPLLQIDGISIKPAISPDGKHAAFLNNIIRGKYRWDMMLSDFDGGNQRRVELQGIAFSRAAYAGNIVSFNELFDDRYEIRRFNADRDPLPGITLKHSPADLRALEKVRLQIDTSLIASRPAR